MAHVYHILVPLSVYVCIQLFDYALLPAQLFILSFCVWVGRESIQKINFSDNLNLMQHPGRSLVIYLCGLKINLLHHPLTIILKL